MYLDYILQKMGSKKPFKNNGKLSKSGIKSYEKLINILYNVSYITDKITPTQIEAIIQDLDKIENE